MSRVRDALRRLLGRSTSPRPDPTRPPPHGPPVPPRALFVVGPGRTGTHFLARVFRETPGVSAYHTDDLPEPAADAFARYCIWNGLPVDLEGHVAARVGWRDAAAAAGRLYVEANPYLCLSIGRLAGPTEGKFVILLRDMEAVVSSFWNKGWFREERPRTEARLAPGPAAHLDLTHVFSRLIPRGDGSPPWTGLTRVGKIARVVSTLVGESLDQAATLPPERSRILRVEEVDHAGYRDLLEFAGHGEEIGVEAFEAIRRTRPGRGRKDRPPDAWSRAERADFERETARVAGRIPPLGRAGP